MNRQSSVRDRLVLILIVVTFLPAPDWPLPTAAGYVYGFWAFPLTYASVAFASVLAFLAARYLLRDIGLHDSPL